MGESDVVLDEVDVYVDLRSACDCGAERGRVVLRRNKLTVWCGVCGQYKYNLSREEIADPTRRQRRSINAKTRARVFRRYQYSCICCNRTDQPLHIAHIVPIAAASALGVNCDTEVLHHEMNLAPMCDECNIGLGSSPVGIALLVRLIAHWINELDEGKESDDKR